jgi:hypothetical protein
MPCPAAVSPRSPVECLSWLRSIRKLKMPAGEKLALVEIALCIGSESGVCWPSVATIARNAGVSPNTARRGILRAERMGMLRIEARPGTSNVFSLTYPETPPKSETGTEVETPPETASAPIQTPPKTASAPLPSRTDERAKERAHTPPTPRGGFAAKPSRERAHRRSRRNPEPLVFAGCHRPAPAEYLTEPPPRNMPVGAMAGLRGALRS